MILLDLVSLKYCTSFFFAVACSEKGVFNFMNYRKMVPVLGLFLTCVFLSAEISAASFLGYSVPINYTSESKADTTVLGGYGYFGYNVQSVEIEYDRVSRADNGDLYQQDYVGIYTYYGVPYTRLKAGFHYVQSADAGVDGTVYIAGAAFDQVSLYGYKSATVGLDLYSSNYTDDTKVLQFSPYMTSYFQPAWPFGYYDFTTKLNFISISGTSSESLNGIETALNYNLYPWKLSAKAWFGHARYGMFSGGNVLYNTADLLRDGYSLSATYSFSPALTLTLGYQFQYLQADGDTSITEVSKVQYMLGYDF